MADSISKTLGEVLDIFIQCTLDEVTPSTSNRYPDAEAFRNTFL